MSEPQHLELARALLRLFTGSHSSARIAMPAWAGGERRTLRDAPQLHHVVHHVLGRERMGFIPYAKDGADYVAWACIDVDTKSERWNLDAAATQALVLRVDAACRARGIFPAWEVSKSGGWHGWVWLGGYVHAIQVRGLLLTILEESRYPVQPFPADMVCPRTNRARSCGNGTWAPLFNAASGGLACKLVDPATMEILPALETLVHLDAHRTPVAAFASFTGPALERFRTPDTWEGCEGEISDVLAELAVAGVTLQVNRASRHKARVRCPFHESKSGDSAFINGSGYFMCTSETCDAHQGYYLEDLVALLGPRKEKAQDVNFADFRIRRLTP